MIITLAKHELKILFLSNRAWRLLGTTQLLLGIIFHWLVEDYISLSRIQFLENTNILGIMEEIVHPFLAWVTLTFLFILPFLTMGSLCRVRQNRTLDLYLCSPISSRDILLGKSLGFAAALTLFLIPILLMPSSLLLSGSLDMGEFLIGLLGVWLILVSALTLGLSLSTFFRTSGTSTLVSLIILLCLSLLEWGVRYLPINFHWIKEFSILYHCKGFLSGFLNTHDILYYVLLISVCLYFGVVRLNQESFWRSRHG